MRYTVTMQPILHMIRQIFRRRSYPSLFCLSCFLTILILREINQESVESKSETSLYHSNVRLIAQNQSKTRVCDTNLLILSSILDSRPAWTGDNKCSNFKISHLIPLCRQPTALASYPGSGNTWLRYLIEGAGGIFTGSRYKDLQIQIFGFWGEIRNWADGTTIVQKTHDASKNHVLKDFGGRAILVLRNPYEAILSQHNFLYAGHHGKAPIANFERKDWHHFLTVQASKWLDMATNWTVYSTPEKTLVVHFENLKSDVKSEMRKILSFLNLPINEERLECLSKYSMGLFHRRDSTKIDSVIPFSSKIRGQMDKLIWHVDNKVLRRRGYPAMPLDKYKYFEKTNEQILEDIESRNIKFQNSPKSKENFDSTVKVDRVHGTQMMLKEYFKYLEIEDDKRKNGNTVQNDDTATLIMRYVYETLGKPKDQESLLSLSKKAEGILSMAVEWWPKLQRPFAKDPIEEALESDGFRGLEIKELTLPE